MSALGQKRTFCDAEAMSALPPKADIVGDAGETRHQSKSHSFLIARTPILSGFTRFFSRRN
jgi:hypothetical protein